jgi:hypothetical protein
MEGRKTKASPRTKSTFYGEKYRIGGAGWCVQKVGRFKQTSPSQKGKVSGTHSTAEALIIAKPVEQDKYGELVCYKRGRKTEPVAIC